MSDIKIFDLNDGTTFRYKKIGKGPPLILLHTIRNRLEYFYSVIPSLKNIYTIYAIDLPGFGDSPVNPKVNYDEVYMRNAIIEFIKNKNLSKVTLAGESIGGVLPITVAEKIPDKIKHIFSFNPYDYDKKFGDGIRRGSLIARFIIWSMSLPFLGNFFAMLESKPILWLIFRGGVYRKSAITNQYLSILTSSIGKPGNLYHLRNVLANYDSWTKSKVSYGKIKTPVTLVYGEYDWSKPSERNETMKLLGLKKFTTISECGHFSFLEAPEKVANILSKPALIRILSKK